jgi:hypothetical protein
MEEDLRAAIAISPEFAPPYGVLAVFLANQGQNLPEALKLARQAQVLEPGNANYQIDMAVVLARMNHYEEARNIALHARANAANPGERAEAVRFLAYLDQLQQYSAGDSDAPESDAMHQSSSTPSAGGSTTGAPANSPNSAQAQAIGGEAAKSGSAPDGGTVHEAIGTVTKLSCMGGLKFELNTDAGKLTLHIKPGTNLPIRLTARQTEPFNACTALQGQRVAVAYQPDDAKGKVGTLESLTVLSGAGDGASGATDSARGRQLGVGTAHSDPVTTSAEGIVTHVVCNGHELTLSLDSGAHSFTLHARDATRVQFEQDVAFDAGDFQPCTQLNGRPVKITFVVVGGKAYDGEIQEVEVEK